MPGGGQFSKIAAISLMPRKIILESKNVCLSLHTIPTVVFLLTIQIFRGTDLITLFTT